MRFRIRPQAALRQTDANRYVRAVVVRIAFQRLRVVRIRRNHRIVELLQPLSGQIQFFNRLEFRRLRRRDGQRRHRAFRILMMVVIQNQAVFRRPQRHGYFFRRNPFHRIAERLIGSQCRRQFFAFVCRLDFDFGVFKQFGGDERNT